MPLINIAHAKPALIEKHGRAVVMAIAVEEYERLTRRSDVTEKIVGLVAEA